MKTQLTASESAKLIELGVSPGKANGLWLPGTDAIIPFALADILDILPKEIKRNAYSNYTFNILADNHYWDVEYRYWGGDHADDTLALFESEELIDALYSLLVWCLEKGYVK